METSYVYQWFKECPGKSSLTKHPENQRNGLSQENDLRLNF